MERERLGVEPGARLSTDPAHPESWVELDWDHRVVPMWPGEEEDVDSSEYWYVEAWGELARSI